MGDHRRVEVSEGSAVAARGAPLAEARRSPACVAASSSPARWAPRSRLERRRRIPRRRFGTAGALARVITVVLALCQPARAQEPAAPPLEGAQRTTTSTVPSVGGPGVGPPEHRIGGGFGLGGGYQAVALGGLSASLGSLSPLDVSLFIPVAPRVELQLWVPLASVVIANVLIGPSFQLDVAAKWYPRGGGAGFFFAPGIGASLATSGSLGTSAFGLAVPLRGGYEFASARRGFGFSLAAKATGGLAVARASEASTTVASYGIGLELGFNFYGVK